MADVLTPEQRKMNMSRIRSKDTGPEMVVRKLVHRLGYRYRLHDRSLPGTPDLVFRSRKKIINVNGCFWHLHDCPFGRVQPKTRVDFWIAKRTGTVERDRRNGELVSKQGWEQLVVWECETRNLESLVRRIHAFLQS